jgi:hypothetical protein
MDKRKKRIAAATPKAPVQEKPPRDLAAARELAAEFAEGYQAIGRFLSEFSQLDFTIRFVLARRLGISDEYFDIVTSPYDFAMLCNVTRELICKQLPQKKRDIEKLFNECLKLNENRVRVAHGMWTLGQEGLVARHVQRRSLQPQYFFDKRNELGRLAEEAQRLMQAVLTIGN